MSSSVPLPQQSASQPYPHASNHIHITPYLRDCERYLLRIISIVAHALLFLLVIRFFIFEPGINDGTSMEPTMRDNTFFIVEKFSLLFSPPQRFDIVQLFDPQDKTQVLVKRIIGRPEETVIFQDNGVTIRDKKGGEQKLVEPYLRTDVITNVAYGSPHEIRIPPNEYFVVGDNRLNSRDSRFFGPVNRSAITGKTYPLMLH